MIINSWDAIINIKACEDTSPAEQSIKISGGKCNREELGGAILGKLIQAMAILGDKAKLEAQVNKLMADNDKLSKKLALIDEANSIQHVAVSHEPEVPPVLDAPVKKTRGRAKS